MSAAVVVLTSPRKTGEPFEYWAHTLEQLEAEDLDVPFLLVCDGKYTGPRLPARWWLYEYARPGGALPGNKLGYWHALARALEHASHDGEAVVLEDDVELCENALRRMATLPVPRDVDWVQFFSPHLFKVPQIFPGLWRPPGGTHLFTQALKFPGRTLSKLAAWSHQREFECYTQSDQALMLASKVLRLKYAAHAPDLVQHAGEQSACSPEIQKLDDVRRSKCWPGPRFNAMDLYMRDDLYR